MRLGMRKLTNKQLAGTSVLVLALVIVGLFLYMRAGQAAGLKPPVTDVIITPLTSGENVTQATISHAGTIFAYSEYDGEDSRLIVQAVNGSSRADILSKFTGKIENLSFTPDDKELYFDVSGSSRGNGLYRVSAGGGAPVKILDGPTSPVSFSADGSEMVFVRSSPSGNGHAQIVRASVDGSKETVLFESKDGQRISPYAVLSHSGNFVIFGSIALGYPTLCSLTKLDVADRTTVPLNDERWDSCYRIALNRDDNGIAFVATRHNDAFSTRRDQVYYLDFATLESQRLTSDGNWHEPASMGITDAGEIIALPLTRISQLWRVNPDGNPLSAEQITLGQADGRSGIVPTGDGKVAFLGRDGDGYAIFETGANGEGRRRLFGAPTMQELRSDPDGTFFVFAEQKDDLTQLFRADRSGGEARQLTFGNSSKIDSTVSPDGKWIVYSDTAFDGEKVRYSLQRIPADGGPPDILSTEACEVPHYSHDGRYISCSSDDRIRIVSASDGALVREIVPEMPFVSNSGARWSPDDGYLVYRVIKNAATNLWRQSISGGQPEQLTAFPKGDLYNFAYGPDGKKLFLSRGTQIRNAILIKGFH